LIPLFGTQVRFSIVNLSTPLIAVMKSFFKHTISILVLATMAYLAMLLHPNWVFAYSHSYGNVTIYSDKVVDGNVETRIDAALDRLANSELFDPTMHFRIFLCHNPYRLGFFARNTKVGGMVNSIVSENIFIREADFVTNKIVPPGTWLMDEENRSLTYFLAHEMTHAMQARHHRFMSLTHPTYLIEGYADYIAKGESFDYEEAIADYRSGHAFYAENSPLYNRQHLAIAYLIEKERLTYKDVMAAPPNLGDVLERLN